MKHRRGNIATAAGVVMHGTSWSPLMALLLLCPPAMAGGSPTVILPTQILQEAPRRVERVFGQSTDIRPTEGQNGNEVLFDPAPWRRIWPDLPADAEFGITVGAEGKVRAVWLDVNAMVREARTGVSREFRFGKREAFAFFHRIFGRHPRRWQKVRLAQGGGGHEGFRDHRFCVEPGLALTITTYRLGEEWIRLVCDPRCR